MFSPTRMVSDWIARQVESYRLLQELLDRLEADAVKARDQMHESRARGPVD